MASTTSGRIISLDGLSPFFRSPRARARLAHLQRGLSRKERGSGNWVKAKIRVARLHDKILNRRTDLLHKVSRKIADTYETVYVEDLKICNMVKSRHLAKSISDAGWGRFIGMIAYKAESAGGRLIRVNANGTTQRCSGCGETVTKDLSQRSHICPYCGLVLDRDLNAALNVLKRGREIRREPPDLKPVEERASTPSGGVVYAFPVKQEASLLVARARTSYITHLPPEIALEVHNEPEKHTHFMYSLSSAYTFAYTLADE